MLGLGGGILMVPLEHFVFGLPMSVAIPVSLAGVVATSIASSIRFSKHETVNVPLGVLIQLAAVTGAIVAVFTVQAIPEKIVKIVFAVALVVGAVVMMTRRENGQSEDAGITALGDLRHRKLGMLVYLISGYATVMLGIGGGIIRVPTMYLLMKTKLKEAMATSVFVIGLPASVGAIGYATADKLDFRLAIFSILGMLAGASLGAGFVPKVRATALKVVFAFVMIYAGIRMVW